MSEDLLQPTILIVDDDEAAVEMLDVLLKNQGYRTVTARSGQQALDIVEQELEHASRWRPWRIDLILLDIMMPGIDGYKVCLRIKDEPALKHIPVVMVTALDNSRDRRTAISFGADGYVTKPYLSDDLMSTIKAHLRVKAYYDFLLRQLAEKELIDAVTTSAHQSLNLPMVIAGTLTALVESGHVDAAAIYELDDTGSSLVVSSMQGAKGLTIPGLPSCPWGEGVVGQIAQTQRSMWADDITGRPDFVDRPDSPLRAYAGAALQVDGRTVGVIELFHTQAGHFDGRDAAWLHELGIRIGLAIENAKTFERTQTMLLKS
ncbi:MAG: response regulator [Chloroflexota bacterium]